MTTNTGQLAKRGELFFLQCVRDNSAVIFLPSVVTTNLQDRAKRMRGELLFMPCAHDNSAVNFLAKRGDNVVLIQDS